MSAKGQRYSRHTYNLAGSSQLVVQLTSEDFEPEVVIHSPSGEIVSEIADYTTPRVVTVTLPLADAGEWEIIATHSAYTDQQLGRYTIQIVEAEPGNRGLQGGLLALRNCPLGEGHVDFPAIVALLAERGPLGRDLVLTMEVPADTIETSIAYARTALSKYMSN